jgi:hypothetical protein
MNEEKVVSLTNARRKAKKQLRQKGITLCSNGFHKWQIWKDKQFDVKQGKLVTVYRCERCGAQKTMAL